MLSQQEIERRTPLWESLSDLWLDTELQNYDHQHIAEILASSGYSFDEIEEIFSEEVAPVVYGNLYTAVGVWDGFDLDWLYKEIIKNLKKQETNFIYRTWVKSGAGKFVMTKMVQEDWKKIIELYKNKFAKINNSEK